MSSKKTQSDSSSGVTLYTLESDGLRATCKKLYFFMLAESQSALSAVRIIRDAVFFL